MIDEVIDVRFGSFATDAVGFACRSMSVVTPTATFFARLSEVTPWANFCREHLQQNSAYLARILVMPK